MEPGIEQRNQDLRERLAVEKPTLILGKETAEDALSRTEIHRAKFNDQTLTVEHIRENELGPYFAVDFEGRKLLFSDTYEIRNCRIAVVAYVQDGDKFIARSYYRSNSHGIWKYLPAYRMKGDRLAWYSKGWGEPSISLPAALQHALAEIEETGIPKKIDDAEFVFAGTARTVAEINTYMSEVDEKAEFLEGAIVSDKEKKARPESVEVKDLTKSPDFSQLLVSWRQDTNLYGRIKVEVYPSGDCSIFYMMCKDQEGRTWIGGIEKGNPIGRTGLRGRWIDGGDLMTPAYEYSTYDAGYGNDKLRSGKYVDMFENYISKIPVIKKYLSRPINISQADNFRELYRVLRERKQIKGFVQTFRADDLIDIIESVRAGKKVEYVTRSEGLRDRVEQLLSGRTDDSLSETKVFIPYNGRIV